jgi:hypothetical protein
MVSYSTDPSLRRRSALAALWLGALCVCGASASRGSAAARWIHGALLPASTSTTVCSTSNGCTPGAFLACPDASQNITDITFASYVSQTLCHPTAAAAGDALRQQSCRVQSTT